MDDAGGPRAGVWDPKEAKESVWLPYLRDVMKCGEDTVVIGHSSGANQAPVTPKQGRVLA